MLAVFGGCKGGSWAAGDEDAFTDMEIVAGGRGRAQTCRRRMHSVVMAASSDFLGHWMEQVLPFPAVCVCRDSG